MSRGRRAEPELATGAPSASRLGGLDRRILAIVAASLAVALTLAIVFPLLDPDEGRNAEVGREMAAGGDLVVPHLAGMPYLDKPVGLFWAEALAIRVLGPIPLAARLPAIVSAIVTLLVLGTLATRQGGSAFAARAVGLLAVAPLFVGLSAYTIFDMPLTACVTVFWISLATELERPDRGTRVWLFAASTLGLLVKGPVMFAWILGGSLGAAVLLRSTAPFAWLKWWPGWLLVLGVAGGWFALASARYPEYPHYAFLEESLERLTGNAFQRDQPLWFVPAVLIGGALPWSLLTPWRRALRGPTPAAARTGHVALGFVAFAAIGFSLSHSKLVTYLLPAIPPMAWLAAAAWSDRARAPSRAGRALFAACLVLPVLLVAGAAPSLLRHAREHSGAALAAAIRSRAPTGAIRYERCYSPGTDYLLGRRSAIVSEAGHEVRSSYQIRYRETLIARGLWTLLAAPDSSHVPDVVVRRARDPEPAPAGTMEFFRDARFVAFASAVR